MKERYDRLTERLHEAAQRSGRPFEEITLVGISKTADAGAVREAHAAGLCHVGENRAQELSAKSDALRDLDLTWHMVGHVQTNKINKLAGRIQVLQSLDRLDLAAALQSRWASPLSCLVEVKTSAEPTKHGLLPADLPRFLDEMVPFENLMIRGLMTVGPLTDDLGEVRAAFRGLRRLYETESGRRPRQEFRWLSMGMSGDYGIAVEEGSTMVRIGTAIFGPRPA